MLKNPSRYAIWTCSACFIQLIQDFLNAPMPDKQKPTSSIRLQALGRHCKYCLPNLATCRFPQPTDLKRLRRRGPRSIASIQRRFVRHGQLGRRLPQGDGLCESSPSSPFALTSFIILQHNMRGFVSHRAEFEAHLQLLGNPVFVGVSYAHRV